MRQRHLAANLEFHSAGMSERAENLRRTQYENSLDQEDNAVDDKSLCEKSEKREKRGGGEVALALDELTDVAAPGDELQQYIDKQEFAEAFNRFLRSLPARDCNIFVRRYYHVDSVESIAKRYGLSRSNVFKILSRTRQALKAFLESEGFAL